MNEKNYVTFSNGHKMPIVGLGTWQIPSNEIEAIVIAALEIGYRHIDTAYVYKTEEGIGNGLKKFLESNKDVKREDIFITTKLPTFGLYRDKVEVFLKKSLERLKLQYVDLYLIHSPIGVPNIDEKFIPIGPNRAAILDLTTNLEDVWKGMEAVCDSGLTKSIGISNLNSKQIQRIVDSAKIQPANLQVECHAYFAQTKLYEFCKDRRITFSAYAPLGNPSFGPFLMSLGIPDPKFPILLTNEVVIDIAKKHKKTPAQVLLRWNIQRGIVVIPKSGTLSRIKENFNVFDFSLPKSEFEELNKLDKNLRFFDADKGLVSAHPEYPYGIPY